MRTYTLQETLVRLGFSSRTQLYRSGLVNLIHRYGKDQYDAVDVDMLAELLARRRALIACGALKPNHPLSRIDELIAYEDLDLPGGCPQCGGTPTLCPPQGHEESLRFARYLADDSGDLTWPAACGWCGWKGEYSS